MKSNAPADIRPFVKNFAVAKYFDQTVAKWEME